MGYIFVIRNVQEYIKKVKNLVIGKEDYVIIEKFIIEKYGEVCNECGYSGYVQVLVKFKNNREKPSVWLF